MAKRTDLQLNEPQPKYTYIDTGDYTYRIGENPEHYGFYFVDRRKNDDPRGEKWYAVSVGLKSLDESLAIIADYAGLAKKPKITSGATKRVKKSKRKLPHSEVSSRR